MSNEILAELNSLFGKFVLEAQSEKTLYPACWKRTILNLDLIANDQAYLKLFTANARTGIYHLRGVIFGRVCDKCKDENAIIWFNAYSKAWLSKEKLPEFGSCCYMLSYSSDNSDD
jgi:hypothetical protein